MTIAFNPTPPITYEINGQKYDFYVLSALGHLRLKTLAKPIAAAAAVLLSSTQTDTGKNIEEYVDQPQGLVSNKTILQPIASDLARFRAAQKEAAFAGLVDALFDEKNMDALTEIIMDSLREPNKGTADIKAFQAKVDLAMMIELLKGMMQANKRVLGPLALRLTEALRETLPQPQPQASPASERADAGNVSNLRAVPNEE